MTSHNGDAPETCGWPTAQNRGCRNPPSDDNGRCWIPSHGDPGATNVGRPSKFNDTRAREAIEAAREGKSKAGCCRAAGVSDGTVDNWLGEGHTYVNEAGERVDFFGAFRRARGDGESDLIEGALSGKRDPSTSRFLLATSYDYVKREERVIDHQDLSDPIVVLDATEKNDA